MTARPWGDDIAGFPKRLEQALLDLASRIGRSYTKRQFSRDVGVAEKGEPYADSQASEWLSGRSTPNLRQVAAMAAVLGLRNGSWLGFGTEEGRQVVPDGPRVFLDATSSPHDGESESPAVSAPTSPPQHPLTEEEIRSGPRRRKRRAG